MDDTPVGRTPRDSSVANAIREEFGAGAVKLIQRLKFWGGLLFFVFLLGGAATAAANKYATRKALEEAQADSAAKEKAAAEALAAEVLERRGLARSVDIDHERIGVLEKTMFQVAVDAHFAATAAEKLLGVTPGAPKLKAPNHAPPVAAAPVIVAPLR